MKRIKKFSMLLVLASGMAAAGPSMADSDWPNKMVKIVVPFPAGGSTDLLARDIAHSLTKKLGETFIVENKPGASSTIGTHEVARSAPDGYTFLVTSSHFAIVPSLYKDLPYKPSELRGVSLLVNLPVVMVASTTAPVNSVQDVIDYDKKNPGKLNFGSSGAGGVNHLSGELFNSMANVSLTHVPYKGAAPAMQDLIGGHVQFMFDAISTSLPHIKAGRIKALAWTGKERSAVLPDLPTIDESGVPGYQSTSWLAMFAPAGVPSEIIQRMSKEVSAALNQPELKERLQSQGAEVVSSTPEELDKIVQEDGRKWSELIEQIDLKLE